MQKKLLQGNVALAEAAVRAGCNCYFGYPITPQTEIMEYLAGRLPEVGGVFLQAESEIAAINMVYGAAGAGARVMTSSSGPGISLKAEGISYLAATELPCVIVNVMRAGPGLGGIQPSQADYLQATRSAGHGGYRCPVLAPSGAQEMADLTYLAFQLADQYRTPVFILADALVGQTKELVELPEFIKTLPAKPWATTGKTGRKRNVINSLYLDDNELENHNLQLLQKYEQIALSETRWEEQWCTDAQIIVVAFGFLARIAKEAVLLAREMGIKAGLFRPVTLWPFPAAALRQAVTSDRKVLVVEMNGGQMLEDVQLAVNKQVPVGFLGKVGGLPPEAREILGRIAKMAGEKIAQIS
ncbi:3-methyl-2-oxobutanoate dehydrogenase subunit VorB [Zhaonella formicivorans]|uniref:3-methyl-2-oxobutanoate dehydrogenase subunit VorB n=1 Tax=Zhaonella formicivorans TaxID=2528593 RepID=UPI0010D83C06|nr:3-methyl-2-oxobutanoate dehydrogenase subunit VorB [Zhaonella formicivorans]